MVAAFIEQTIGDSMTTTEEVVEKEGYVLKVSDRCDSCSAQAYVQVVGVTGDLMFCSHHYNSIVDNAVGYDKIMKFAYQITDERDRLIENRLKDE